MSQLDPAGPAAMIRAATGATPKWAGTEYVRMRPEVGMSWQYKTKLLRLADMRELIALSETRWHVTVAPNHENISILIVHQQ